MSKTPIPVVSLVDEDPVQAMRNAVVRIRQACESTETRPSGELSALETMKFTIGEELEVLEEALQRVQPT